MMPPTEPAQPTPPPPARRGRAPFLATTLVLLAGTPAPPHGHAQEPAAPLYPEAVPDARNHEPEAEELFYYTDAPLEDVVDFYRGEGAKVEETGDGTRVALKLKGPASAEVTVEGEPPLADGALRRARARAEAALARGTDEEPEGGLERRGRMEALEERYEDVARLHYPHVKDDKGQPRSVAARLYDRYQEELRTGRLMDPTVLREEAVRRADEEELDPELRRILEAVGAGDGPSHWDAWVDYLERVEKEGFTTRLRIPRAPDP